MGLFSNPPTAPISYRDIRPVLLPAGLLAAACVAVLEFPVPHGHILSWTELVGLIVEETFTLSIVCVVTVAALTPRVLRRNKAEFLQLLQRASVAAIWLAPFVLFLRESSPWSLPIAALLAILVIPSLQPNRGPLHADADTLWLSFSTDLTSSPSTLRLQKSILAAMSLQIGTLSALGGHTAAGALLVAISFAVWTWDYDRQRPDPSEASKTNPALALLVVCMLMIVGLFPYLQHGGGHGATAAHFGLFPNRLSGGNSKGIQRYSAAQVLAGHRGEDDQGIILWGEKKNYTKLVAPTPVVMNALNTNGNANPLVIPFDGVYWFFKSPDEQPPAGSRQAQTTPDIVDIHSTDRRPLSIEAHDHLANLIELDCCSRVEIAIRNADRYPESVWLELVLVNTTMPHNPSVSLGRVMVNSTRPWKFDKKQPSVDETLSFPIPKRGSLRAFDEVKIVFLLDRTRADDGARIAIDHFVLVPRGL
jgi:hypothetical protein